MSKQSLDVKTDATGVTYTVITLLIMVADTGIWSSLRHSRTAAALHASDCSIGSGTDSSSEEEVIVIVVR